MEVLVLPGDGIGPEITAATLAVLDRANAKFGLGLKWKHDQMGFATLKTEGTTLPERILETGRKCAGVILGPVSHLDYPPREQGGINPSGAFRVKLDLYANIRPAKSRMGVGLTGKPVDMIIFRECTEGFYADRNMHMGIGEFMPTEDMAMAVRRVTAKCCERIARRAFEAAQESDGRAQGQCAEDFRRIVFARSAQGGQGLSGRATGGNHRRCHGRADTARPDAF